MSSSDCANQQSSANKAQTLLLEFHLIRPSTKSGHFDWDGSTEEDH